MNNDIPYLAEFSLSFGDDVIHIGVVSFTPERPAPACSNPDSPLFSDPGDDGEVEYQAWVFDSIGQKIPILLEDDELTQRVYDMMASKYDEAQAREMEEYYNE